MECVSCVLSLCVAGHLSSWPEGQGLSSLAYNPHKHGFTLWFTANLPWKVYSFYNLVKNKSFQKPVWASRKNMTKHSTVSLTRQCFIQCITYLLDRDLCLLKIQSNSPTSAMNWLCNAFWNNQVLLVFLSNQTRSFLPLLFIHSWPYPYNLNDISCFLSENIKIGGNEINHHS